MRQTLFTIPYTLRGIPLFGVGVLLGAWTVITAVIVYRTVRRHGWSNELWGMLPSLALVGIGLLFAPRVFPGGLPIRGYGVMVLLGVLAGVGLAMHRARQLGLDPEIILALVLWLLIPGVVGARAFHVIEYWNTDYRHDTWTETVKAVLNVPQGGLVVYGALFGAGLGFLLFTWRKKLGPLALADLIAPSLALGLALGRIGCFLNGCCYGGPTDLPWAVRFPAGSPPYESQLRQGELLGLVIDGDAEGRPRIRPADHASRLQPQQHIEKGRLLAINGQPVRSVADARYRLHTAVAGGNRIVLTLGGGRQIMLPLGDLPRRSLPVHPTQLYSSITAALLCFFLWSYFPFRRHEGEVTALLLTLYPLLRMLLETIRTDEQAVFHTGLSISQNVSLVLLLSIVGLWAYVLSKPRLNQVGAENVSS